MESENDTVAKTIVMDSEKINKNNDLSLNRSKEKYFVRENLITASEKYDWYIPDLIKILYFSFIS